MVVTGQANEGMTWGERGQLTLPTKVLIEIGFK